MKKLIYSTFALLLMAGCGGGGSKSSLVDNKTLGKFPAAFVRLAQEQNQQREDMQADIQARMDPDKLRDKYVALETESMQRAQETATAELEKIVERTVPVEIAWEHPDFQIRSAMIDGGDTKTGALTITVVVGAKRDLTASMDAKLNYRIMGTDGSVLFGGSINPFAVNQVITSRNFPHGLQVAAGDVCTDQGSWLMLYCGSYDFTTFDKIVFVQ